MTSASDLVTLLTAELDSDALQLGEDPAKYAVVEFNMALAALLDKYLLKCNSPADTRVDVLFTVREAKATASRYLQQVPHTDKIDFEVGVWLTVLKRDTVGEFAGLRDDAVAEVKRVFNENPDVANYRGLRVDDHVRGQLYILNSIITVTHTIHG